RLYNRNHLDGKHLKSIFDDVTAHNGGICSHAYNILIVVVIRNAVDVHRCGQSLVFGSGGGSGKLYALHTEVESKLSEVHKRRQNFVDFRIEQVIELAFGKHGEFGYHEL